MPAEAVKHFAASDEAAAALPHLLVDSDTMLLKGSRGMKLETLVESVIEWKADATVQSEAAEKQYHDFRSPARQPVATQ
jgi:hypothetical protein